VVGVIPDAVIVSAVAYVVSGCAVSLFTYQYGYYRGHKDATLHALKVAHGVVDADEEGSG
jgi:hypothetical protein